MDPQLINNLITYGPLLVSVAAFAYAVYLNYLFSKEFPSKSLINRLRAEVDEFSGDLADLTDRFSRFQKREGMRAAREKKTADGDLVAQAREIVAQGGSGEAQPTTNDEYTSPKADLYRKARSH